MKTFSFPSHLHCAAAQPMTTLFRKVCASLAALRPMKTLELAVVTAHPAYCPMNTF